MAHVDHDLPFRVEFHVRSIHGPRRGAFEIDAFGVVTTAVTGALEFVLAGLPIGSAAQVCTDGPMDLTFH
jgi:hypothetical protein